MPSSEIEYLLSISFNKTALGIGNQAENSFRFWFNFFMYHIFFD